MNELLKELLVPGGAVTALIAYLAANHKNNGQPKTSTAEVHADEAKRIADDAGLTDEYRKLYRDVIEELQRMARDRKEDHTRLAEQDVKIEGLVEKVDSITSENRELKRRNDYLMWRDAEHLLYEDALHEHIDRQLPPPGPKRPYHLNPFPKE